MFFITDFDTHFVVDECKLGVDNCDEHAMCIDTDDAFTCQCTLGYIGSGQICGMDNPIYAM